MAEDSSAWLDSGAEGSDDIQVDEYDLTSTPNDFNISTIYNFIESGAVKIPGFQRNYVWDLKRASKLIESLIIGLPVPQVFLYEEGRNSFLVIDGQQRLMTLYYFMRQRFPKREKRAEIRRVFNEYGKVPDEVLHSDDYFESFNLRLSDIADGKANKFNRLNYGTLGDHRTQFELRTIRNVIVKQLRPSGDDSSIYEMFNRLNTGGINLTPQEVRSSLYHSKFYDELFRLNLDGRWRALIGQSEPDLHMRDIEVLLRGIAMWLEGDTYAPSMVKFLNRFSKTAQSFDTSRIAEITAKVDWFLNACKDVPRSAFLTRQQRFSLPLFEAIFAAACASKKLGEDWRLELDQVQEVANDESFLSHSSEQTTNTSHVKGRITVGRRILSLPRNS